jgi:hypothetical protein
MQFSDWNRYPHRGNSVPPSAAWSHFASSRPNLSAAPACSRPSLFAGD